MYDNTIILFRDAQDNGTKLVIIYLMAVLNLNLMV